MFSVLDCILTFVIKKKKHAHKQETVVTTSHFVVEVALKHAPTNDTSAKSIGFQVQRLREAGDRHASNKTPGRCGNDNGNPLFAFCASKRKAHSRAGLRWTNRAALERSWAQEWRNKSPQEKDRFTQGLSDQRALRAVDRMVDQLPGGDGCDVGDAAPPQPQGRTSSNLLATLGDDDFACSRERVELFLRQHSDRMGVGRLSPEIRGRS